MYLYLMKMTSCEVRVLKNGYVDKYMCIHEMQKMQKNKKNWNIKIHNPKNIEVL